MAAPKRTEIQITGQIKQTYNKVEKKYYKSIRIPTGDDFYIQSTLWVPFTPGYSKLPKVVITLNNHREKMQILFPTALDLMEFCDVLQSFVKSELMEINKQHTEAVKDYQMFHEILQKTTDLKHMKQAEIKYHEAQQEKQPEINDDEKAPF